MDTNSKHSPAAGGHAFVTTRWSVVLSAGRQDTTRAQAALASLCQTYWFPLYSHVRRRGYSPEDSQDLTQEFFARLLAQNWIATADRERGRFRTFLLTALNRFLANEWDRARAQKRGAGVFPLSINTETAEQRFRTEVTAQISPDRLYDRQWALTLLDRAMRRLREAHTATGKTAEFEVLCRYIDAQRGEIPYSEIAASLACSEEAARQAIHRLRKQFRQVFRDEIAQTVEDPNEIEQEIRYLLGVLAE